MHEILYHKLNINWPFVSFSIFTWFEDPKNESSSSKRHFNPLSRAHLDVFIFIYLVNGWGVAGEAERLPAADSHVTRRNVPLSSCVSGTDEAPLVSLVLMSCICILSSAVWTFLCFTCTTLCWHVQPFLQFAVECVVFGGRVWGGSNPLTMTWSASDWLSEICDFSWIDFGALAESRCVCLSSCLPAVCVQSVWISFLAVFCVVEAATVLLLLLHLQPLTAGPRRLSRASAASRWARVTRR